MRSQPQPDGNRGADPPVEGARRQIIFDVLAGVGTPLREIGTHPSGLHPSDLDVPADFKLQLNRWRTHYVPNGWDSPENRQEWVSTSDQLVARLSSAP